MKSGAEYFNTIEPSADINLLFAGYEQCPAGKICGGIRSHFLLHYVLAGHGTVTAGDRTFRLSQNDLFCYFPEQPLQYAADQEIPWQFAWIGFQGRRAAEVLKLSGIRSPLAIRRASDGSRIRELIDSLLHFQRMRKKGFDIICDGLLLEILGELCAAVPLYPGKDGVDFPADEVNGPDLQVTYVESMKRFMQSNYQNSITVQHVIDYIGIDRSYASRIFHRFENRTIQQYLIGIRMNKARQLLEDGQLSVRNVAFSVGYRDYSTFERRFRLETGCSPSAYTDR
jgi:AraC-like DNA-binding protein